VNLVLACLTLAAASETFFVLFFLSEGLCVQATMLIKSREARSWLNLGFMEIFLSITFKAGKFGLKKMIYVVSDLS